MKALILGLIYLGIMMVTIGYVNQLKKCPPVKVEYRFIPRTFEEEQDNPVSTAQIFDNMFTDATPWIAGTRIGGERELKTNASINKYFISQA